MPVGEKSEMVRFALPVEIADEIRELLVDRGVGDPKIGVWFRENAKLLIELERQSLDLLQIRSDVAKISGDFSQMLQIFHKFARVQAEQISRIESQIAEIGLELALSEKGAKK